METKPYSLQSPEQIAKDYGGNKQRIAEAMQMGIVDPTAGTMAGMFIDRMRAAQQQEMAPQPTVAQQVFAPPAPPMGAAPIPAGLGATPQAAAMAAAAPQMMAPPPPPAPPMGAPGMAAGGLTTLPLPDAMFDEPDVGGYASGGLVAFDRGGGVVDPKRGLIPLTSEMEDDTEYPSDDTVVNAATLPEPPAFRPEFLQGIQYVTPSEMGGFRNTGRGNLNVLERMAPRETKYAEQLSDYLQSQLNPQAQRERQQQDMWSMLGQLGARMASTPGSLLQAVSAGISEAVPATAAAARERRAEERQLREALVGEERTGNRELEARAGVALDMLGQYNTLAEAFNDRSLTNTLERLGFDMGVLQSRISAGATIRSALIDARVRRDVGLMDLDARRLATWNQLYEGLRQNRASDPEYMRRFATNPNDADRYLRGQATTELESIFGRGGPSRTIQFDNQGNPLP